MPDTLSFLQGRGKRAACPILSQTCSMPSCGETKKGGARSPLMKYFFQSSEQVRPGVRFFREFSDLGRR